MTNPMQPVHQAATNDPVTPHDTPSSPAGYASVFPHGQGPAPYDIQAPQADVTGEFNAANAVSGAGPLYAAGPRQSQTAALLQSPQGFAVSGYDIDAGSADRWPNNIEPPGM